MFDKRSSFLDRLTQPGPKHNVRSKRMGLLDEGKKYPTTGSNRSRHPTNWHGLAWPRNYSADAIAPAV